MKTKIALIFCVLTLNMSCAQSVERNSDTKFTDFVKSFKEENTNDILDFLEVLHRENPMSKEEALSLVYKTDDTTMLYCKQYIFSMETEEIFGVNSELYLPNKCLKINMGNYFLIAYNSYRCQSPDEQYNSFLNLLVIDEGFNVRDSMLVCNEDELNPYINGLLNPKNGKIFLFKYENVGKALMYKVNETTLKFEFIRKEDLSKGTDAYNLMNTVEKIGWKEEFLE